MSFNGRTSEAGVHKAFETPLHPGNISHELLLKLAASRLQCPALDAVLNSNSGELTVYGSTEELEAFDLSCKTGQRNEVLGACRNCTKLGDNCIGPVRIGLETRFEIRKPEKTDHNLLLPDSGAGHQKTTAVDSRGDGCYYLSQDYPGMLSRIMVPSRDPAGHFRRLEIDPLEIAAARQSSGSFCDLEALIELGYFHNANTWVVREAEDAQPEFALTLNSWFTGILQRAACSACLARQAGEREVTESYDPRNPAQTVNITCLKL